MFQFLKQSILFEVMVDGFAVVVFKGDDYGDEMAIGYEGVEIYIGDFFEHIFSF